MAQKAQEVKNGKCDGAPAVASSNTSATATATDSSAASASTHPVSGSAEAAEPPSENLLTTTVDSVFSRLPKDQRLRRVP